MRRIFTSAFSWVMLIAMAMFIHRGFAAGPRHHTTAAKNDTLHYSANAPKKPKKKGLFSFTFPPLKAGSISNVKLVPPPQQGPNDKLLTSVEIYPNPITDHINLKYSITRYSAVSIKLMDVLGNAP